MNYRKTIRDMWTDDDGNYKLGLDNAITPEALLEKMGIVAEDMEDERDYKELYQTARIELNAVCIQLCKEGYRAGGVSRTPTHYLIAKNPTEQRMLISARAKGNIGRLTLLKWRGDGIISHRMINGSINQLLPFIDEDEIEDDEDDD